MSNTVADAKVLDFWRRRRSGLSEAEWVEFYGLLVPLLMRTRLDRDYADQRKRRELVDLFFTDKVLLNAETTLAGPLKSVHVLHKYLKRFAGDLQRKEGRYIQLDDGEELADDEMADEAPVSVRFSPAAVQVLAEAGIDLEPAAASARRFVSELEPWETAYLRHHSCEEDEAKEPVSSIAQRLKLGTSYHYKARALGITRSKGETFHGYGDTKIGRWLLSVGARLESDWKEEIGLLLVLLCQAVNDGVEDQA